MMAVLMAAAGSVLAIFGCCILLAADPGAKNPWPALGTALGLMTAGGIMLVLA